MATKEYNHNGNWVMVKASILALIAYLLAPAPNRELTRDTEEQSRIAGEFIESAEKWDMSPELLAIWAFGEASFSTDRVGSLGEIGLFQVHGGAQRRCEQYGLDLSTSTGQIECGAYLFAMGRDRCGSLEGGLRWYACGDCEGTQRAKRIVKYRMQKAGRWRREH